MKIIEYLEKLEDSPINREGTKYYEEMQQLAYNLVRYLRMNEDEYEHQFQGNYNLTYLIENMTNEDFEFVVTKLLRNIPLGDLKRLIYENFYEHFKGGNIMDFSKCSDKELKEFKKQLDNEEEKRREKEREQKRKKVSEKLEVIKNSGILNYISHERTSCDDDYPINGYYEPEKGCARCKKCHLIKILNEHENGIHEFDVNIDISIDII